MRPLLLRCLLSFLALALVLTGPAEAARRRHRKREALRFAGRLQALSGVALGWPADAGGDRRLGVYVPLDLEWAFRVTGPLSLSLGAVAYAAPFDVPACPGPGGGRRPSAIGALAGVRFDFNNSRDGSWLSPWAAIRVGVVAQDGVAWLDAGGCFEQVALAALLSPRVGLDLWLGRAAVTFALGYDVLPRSQAAVAQLGLTLRLF